MTKVETHGSINDQTDENKEDKEDKNDKEDGGILITIIFYLFGMGTLIGTNSMLNQLNFVEYFQKKINPFLSMVLLDNFSNIPLQLLLLIKKKLFNLKKQLIFSLITLSICIILFPLIVFLLENKLIGNILTLLLAIIIGVIGSLLKSGFFALGSFFPIKNIVSLSTGQGVSGIFMALLGLIIRFAVNTDNEEKDLRNGALIFFGVCLLLSIITFISLIYIYKSKYGKYHISKGENEENKEEKKEENNDNHEKVIMKENAETDSNNNILHLTHKKNDENHPINENSRNKNNNKDKNSDNNSKYNTEKNNNEISFFDLFKLLKEVNFLMFYNYIISYALYPYACKAQELFKSGEYRVNIIILLYSCFNTIGRYLMKFFKPTKRKNYVIVLIRTIFLFTIIFNHYLYFSLNVNYKITSTLLVINIILLGISNGFATSLGMGYAPTLLSDELKGKAGASVSFALSVGSAVGSCVAFGVESIMKNIGEL